MSSFYSLLGRIGAHVLHATHDPKITTAPARCAFLGRFEREADPDGTLDPAERARRARHLRAVYFSRLALRSAQVRRERALRRQRQNGGHAS
jgi:hypothetical protein